MFFSGQGPVFAGAIDPTTGAIGAMFDLGNMESVKFGFEANVITDKESKSGNRLVAARLETELNSTFEIVMKEPNMKNIEMMLRAARVTNVGATVTDEINSQSGLVAGDYIITKFQNISSVSVKDSAGSPATLTVTTDYVVESTKFGRIRIVNPGSYTQPFKVSYTYASRVVIPLFNSSQKDFFIHMEGINTVDSTNFLAEFYKTRFSPPSEFNLLQDEFGRYTISGEAQIDPIREPDTNYGRFGRLVNPL
jgi:hypothetical protein